MWKIHWSRYSVENKTQWTQKTPTPSHVTDVCLGRRDCRSMLLLQLLLLTVTSDARSTQIRRYFSDFTVDWTPTQMNQNVVYVAEWAIRRLWLALIYFTFISRSLLANAHMGCRAKLHLKYELRSQSIICTCITQCAWHSLLIRLQTRSVANWVKEQRRLFHFIFKDIIISFRCAFIKPQSRFIRQELAVLLSLSGCE